MSCRPLFTNTSPNLTGPEVHLRWGPVDWGLVGDAAGTREHIRQIMWLIIGNNVQIVGVQPNYEIMRSSPVHHPRSLFEVMLGKTGVSNTGFLFPRSCAPFYFLMMVQIWYFMARAVRMIESDWGELLRRHPCNGCWLAPGKSSEFEPV